MKDSTDRAAWTQYEEQGMGSGLSAFNHRQPSLTDSESKRLHPDRRKLDRNYYVTSKGNS